jgi:hypothetical protein
MDDEYIKTKEEARAIAKKLSEKSGEYREVNGKKVFLDSENYCMEAMPFYCDTPKENGSVCKNVIGCIDDLFLYHDICCGFCFPEH